MNKGGGEEVERLSLGEEREVPLEVLDELLGLLLCVYFLLVFLAQGEPSSLQTRHT